MRRAITGWIHEISSLSITFGGAKWAALARRTTARASIGCTIVNSTFESMNTRVLLTYHQTYQNYDQSHVLPLSTHLELRMLISL